MRIINILNFRENKYYSFFKLYFKLYGIPPWVRNYLIGGLNNGGLKGEIWIAEGVSFVVFIAFAALDEFTAGLAPRECAAAPVFLRQAAPGRSARLSVAKTLIQLD